ADIHLPLDVQRHLRTTLALDLVIVLDDPAHTPCNLFRPIVRVRVVIDSGTIEDLASSRPTDSVNRGQGNLAALAGGYVYSSYSWHVVSEGLTLALLVLRDLLVDNLYLSLAALAVIDGSTLLVT